MALIIAFLKLRERGRRTRASRLVLLFNALSASSWKIVEEKFMKSKGGRVVGAEEIQVGIQRPTLKRTHGKPYPALPEGVTRRKRAVDGARIFVTYYYVLLLRLYYYRIE